MPLNEAIRALLPTLLICKVADLIANQSQLHYHSAPGDRVARGTNRQ